MFFYYKFAYSNPNLTVVDFFNKVKDFLEGELEIENIKALTQKLEIPLFYNSAFALVNQRATQHLFDKAREYVNAIITSITYLSQLMKELAIWERVNSLYEELINYNIEYHEYLKKAQEAKSEDEKKKYLKRAKRFKILSEHAMVELKNFWMNNYDTRNDSLINLQKFGFTGIVTDFLRYWEEGLELSLLSDDPEERRKAKLIALARVNLGVLKKDLVVSSVKESIEEIKKKLKMIDDILEKLKDRNLLKEDIYTLEEKINSIKSEELKKIEDSIDKAMPDLRYKARVLILTRKLDLFYDWLYTNYKVVRSAYLSYRALVRLNLFMLYEYVKTAKWYLKMYELARLHEGLNPHGFQYLKKGFFDFSLLVDKEFSLSDEDIKEYGLENKEFENKFKLVAFLKVSMEASLKFEQEVNFYNLAGKYKMEWFFSILTPEEYEKLKAIELMAELNEIELIGKEFLENFLREIREFVERGYYFSLTTFYNRISYLSSDVRELLLKAIRKNPELAKDLEKLLKKEERKEEEKKEEKSFLVKALENILKIKLPKFVNDLALALEKFIAYIVILLFDYSKLVKIKKKEEEKEEKEKISVFEVREKLLKKPPKDVKELIKEKFMVKLKEAFGVRKDFISDKLYK